MLKSTMNRRNCLQWLGGMLAAPYATCHASTTAARPVAAFVKFVQSLSYDELAERLAAMGFAGIEATIRRGGQIEPPQAEEELPKLVEALRRHDLQVLVMASDINDASDPLSERVLRTAAGLGIERYRMAYYRYHDRSSIEQQLRELQPQVDDLAALNADLGIGAVYQNHSGARIVGSTVWDIHHLIREIDPAQIGIAFDIRHATVEAGQSWSTLFRLIQSRLGAVYVKDFRWGMDRPTNVPLGEGRVSPEFLSTIPPDFSGPLSLHVEYLGDGTVEENMAALQRDLNVLRGWLS